MGNIKQVNVKEWFKEENRICSRHKYLFHVLYRFVLYEAAQTIRLSLGIFHT